MIQNKQKQSKPSRIGRRARHQGPHLGFRQRGSFEIFEKVAPIECLQIEAPFCA